MTVRPYAFQVPEGKLNTCIHLPLMCLVSTRGFSSVHSRTWGPVSEESGAVLLVPFRQDTTEVKGSGQADCSGEKPEEAILKLALLGGIEFLMIEESWIQTSWGKVLSLNLPNLSTRSWIACFFDPVYVGKGTIT